MSDKEGIDMIRYYGVLGPMVVKAIKSDVDPLSMYQYIWAEYLIHLEPLIDSKDGTKKDVMTIYLKLMDDMVKIYDIKVGKRFKQWVV